MLSAGGCAASTGRYLLPLAFLFVEAQPMTPAEAQQIIEVLARGVDPATGEVLPDDSPLSSPHVIRALFIAAKALELMAAAKPARPAAAAPGNAGKSWTDEEDQRLVAGTAPATPVAALARTHERTTGAINSRLVKLGRLQASDKSPPT
jgi:predicted component of type VI protein secretion system